MLQGLKIVAKAIRRRVQTAHASWHAFTPDAFEAALRTIGLETGDTAYVHTSMSGFSGFRGKPTDIVATLEKVLGPEGTVLMPSHPFSGSALVYAQSGQLFDVNRTPSRMGLVSELFRRGPGTVRSQHPTHAVVGRGAKASAFLNGHELARTPCGLHSPYAGLADADAKILLLGVGIGVLTYWHHLEEVLETQFPASPFTTDSYAVPFKGRGGEILSVQTRFFDPQMSKRRNLRLMEHALKKAGLWYEHRVGTLRIVMLKAADVKSVAAALCRSGTNFYE
jgi:aminoglycoside 3-N-acetyltransferase